MVLTLKSKRSSDKNNEYCRELKSNQVVTAGGECLNNSSGGDLRRDFLGTSSQNSDSESSGLFHKAYKQKRPDIAKKVIQMTRKGAPPETKGDKETYKIKLAPKKHKVIHTADMKIPRSQMWRYQMRQQKARLKDKKGGRQVK